VLGAEDNGQGMANIVASDEFNRKPGETWTRIGSVLQMAYTLPHFMGYRFGLFNVASQTAGGFVDFDYYRVSDEISME
jgi:hypothetical protein